MDWLVLLPGVRKLIRFIIDIRLGRYHKEGYAVLRQIQVGTLPVQEAQRIVARWVNDVDRYLWKAVRDRAALFRGDFDTTNSIWLQRQGDDTMRQIDEMIQGMSLGVEGIDETAMRYRDDMMNQPIRIMQDKLAHLEEIIRRA